MNKNISVWRGEKTPPTKYHLWLKDDTIYVNIEDEWLPLASIKGSPLHKVTKELIGLGNVDNTSDQDKPVSTLQKKAIDKVAKDVNDSITSHTTRTDNPHSVTKTQVGLSNVTNDSQVKRSEMGLPLGVATLDKFGKVPESLLPSYVDDVLEFEDKSAFPDVGESDKIYITLDNNLTYRWTGSTYIKIGGSGGIVNVESIPDDYINALDESLLNNHK